MGEKKIIMEHPWTQADQITSTLSSYAYGGFSQDLSIIYVETTNGTHATQHAKYEKYEKYEKLRCIWQV